ncbi:MAG: adenosine deaminase, partial [Oscillospiraceae bacterium]|nr:adenosine deaminase [Oscillospiraceae bacterium]
KSAQGKKLLEKIRQNRVVLEFQLSSNVRLNNIIDLHTHPLKAYLKNGIACVMGSDGCGLYGTDSIDEQLALTNFLKITDDEFLKMKAAEEEIISRQEANFKSKMAAFVQNCGQNNVADYYAEQLSQPIGDVGSVNFEINKKPSYPVLKSKVTELPWDKYPVVIAGGSFAGRGGGKVSDADKALLHTLLDSLDPEKVFFVVGHRLAGQEKYIVDNNKGFDIYSIVPSLMTARQLQRMQKADIAGCRISTESQEMGIYKSFNYEIFERRNCVLFAFDGNSSVANLVQEARNGKGRCWIFAYPKSAMLRAKVDSLDGYVTLNAPAQDAVNKICEMQNNIGTRIE